MICFEMSFTVPGDDTGGMVGNQEFEREGFESLSHPVRLGILEALGERLQDQPADPTVGFSDLRREVGMRDSGNFNYHLDKLRGRFVRNTDDGYQITAAGLQVVAAVISGTYSGEKQLGPTELGEQCPACAEELTATYQSGLLTVSCPTDHEFRHPLPQGSVAERDIDEVVRLLTLTVQQDMQLASDGICPLCNDTLSWSVDPSFDTAFPHFETQCERCGALFDLPVVVPLLAEPVGVCFYHDHGIDARREPPWSLVFYDGVTVTASLPVEVSVTHGEESLVATLTEDLSIAEISRVRD
jgi:hypothetical protein